jgi:hypothetical protein
MFKRAHKSAGGYAKFFLINLCHESLANYYKMNFALMQYHKYSLTELENMIPFEREVYVYMLVQYLEEEKKRIQSIKS